MQVDESLKKEIKEYCELDNQIRSINETVHKLREQRSCVEDRIVADYLSKPQYASYQKISLQDGSFFQIKRPNEWQKTSPLSQSELKDYLYKYFTSTTSPNPEGCFEYIMNQKKQSSVSSQFNLVRVVASEKSKF